MNFIKKNGLGIIVCLMIAIPSWFLGKALPLLGGAVIAILIGMAVTLIWTNKGKASFGIAFTSKYILQAAGVRNEPECGCRNGDTVIAYYNLYHNHVVGNYMDYA